MWGGISMVNAFVRALSVGAVLTAFGVPVTPSHATTFAEVDFTCPIGGEKFKDHVMMSTSIFGRRLDFKPIPLVSIAAYPKCPRNGFVLFEREFTAEQIEKLTPVVATAEYQSLAKANATHYLAAHLKKALGAPKPEIAHELLLSIFEGEDANTGDRALYLKETVEALDLATPELKPGTHEWHDNVYLGAELQRQRGEFTDAAARLAKLKDAKIEAEPERLETMKLFRDQVQALIDAKNSQPKEFVPPEEKPE
jgi:hypothetical protein